MPNWATNEIKITGDYKTLKKIKERMQVGQNLFDFNGVIPSPQELIGISHGGNTIGAKRYKSWRNVGCHGCPEGIGEEESKGLVKKYGADNLYDWNCQNWGTKWNACDVCRIPIHKDMHGEHYMVYRFDTPWGPPVPIFEKMVEVFPNVLIEASCHIEGEGDIGEERFGEYKPKEKKNAKRKDSVRK